MTGKVVNLFWDSCCFIAYLNEEKDKYDIPSLEQFLDDARSGRARIYSSTITLAEVRPSFLKKKSIGTFADFVEDLSGAVILLDPMPDIMTFAGHLKDLRYKKQNSDKRQMATPDAIMLASCVYLRDTLGVQVDHFHTYDEGKKRGLDGGKGVPILSYHEWCDGIAENTVAGSIISLSRKKPLHPEPKFP